MDAQLARTLGELERKLSALERTLTAIGHAQEAAPVTPSAPAAPSAPAVSGAAPAYGAPSATTAPPTATAAPTSTTTAPSTTAAPPPASAGGRLVDEAIEPPAPLADRPFAVAPPAETPRSVEPGPFVPASAPPRPAAPATASGPPPAGAPAGPLPTAELLRFRERLERSARELTDEYDELLGRLSYPAVSSVPGPTISFARGVPSLDIIDVAGLRDAAMRAFDADPEGVTAYGTAVGYPRLRAWIADRHGVAPERVLVTNGSLQADAFLFDQVVGGGDEVVVESPTYDRTLLGLKERGARLHAVPLDAAGIDTGELARLLAAGARPTLAHVIPNFQNPAGYTLSLARRRELVALAAAHNFLILEDDPYAELRFSGEPQPTMLSMEPDRVVYASSFTKTVCPGVRVGYLVGPPDLIAGITRRATNTYISPGMVSEALVYEFCASGALDRSIETVKAALAERAHTLAAALRRDIPEAEFVEPQGGYFLWVTLPAGTDVAGLFDAAAARGVAFVKGADFMLHGGENAFRLAYSGVTPAEIEQGIERLAEAYRSL